VVSSADIARAVGEAIAEAATTLRPDVRAALERALLTEPSGRGREVIAQLL
jgi:tartrate dehydratase alpha subunit/fumarate hydratase class I-like protein